jgi:hypothetical protein
MTEELRQDIQRRVRAVQQHYHDGGRALRAVWIVGAVVVVIAGLAMTVLPGPATIVIPIGLAMLAVRFRWAQWALRQVIDRGVRLHRAFVKASPAVRLGSTAGLLGVAAVVVLLVLR